MRFLVIGASGFAGSHLVAHLLCRGHQVTGTSRSGRRGHARGHGDALIWRRCEVTDLRSVQRLLRDQQPEIIVNLAAEAHPATCGLEPGRALLTSGLGSHNVVYAAGEVTPGARVVQVSSGAVHGAAAGCRRLTERLPPAPDSTYGACKLAGEALARTAARDVELVTARPFQHFGPGQDARYVIASLARQVARAEAGRSPPVIEVGNLEVRRVLTPVADVVAAYEALGTAGVPGRTYLVAAGKPRPIREYLDLLLDHSRMELAVRQVATRLRGPEVDTPPISTRPLRQDTSWHPGAPLRQALETTLDHWRGLVRRGRD
jgi:GDP-4-dehydro-6-deoxy-D-mannose reductase